MQSKSRLLSMFSCSVSITLAIALASFSAGCEQDDAVKPPPSGENSGGAEGAPAGPGAESTSSAKPTTEEKERVEPEHITLQHILIGFRDSVPGKGITRTKEEAATLAKDIVKKAKEGGDFDALVREYTDDQAPGIYKLANRGARANRAAGEYPRDGMVPAFGNVGFALEAGEVGLAEYDPKSSPYGWHVIKRIE